MPFVTLDGPTLHYRLFSGTGAPIVFLNSLGTDFRIWEDVIAALNPIAPVLCIDKRGHGLSDDSPISMDLLVDDVAKIMDLLGLRGGLICGVSVGGLIAQGLGAKRPDLVAGLILSNTGAKIGDKSGWNARIDVVENQGIQTISDAILERWFSTVFRTENTAALAGYRNMLTRTSPRGYAGVCRAIRDTDFSQSSAKLNVPTLCIAGSEDQATPPDLVKALADIVPNAEFRLVDNVGHLPSIEKPGFLAKAVSQMYDRLI